MTLKRMPGLAVLKEGDVARRRGKARRKATRTPVNQNDLPWQLGDSQQFYKVKAIMSQAALDDPTMIGKEKQVIGHVIASLNPDKPWAYPSTTTLTEVCKVGRSTVFSAKAKAEKFLFRTELRFVSPTSPLPTIHWIPLKSVVALGLERDRRIAERREKMAAERGISKAVLDKQTKQTTSKREAQPAASPAASWQGSRDNWRQARQDWKQGLRTFGSRRGSVVDAAARFAQQLEDEAYNGVINYDPRASADSPQTSIVRDHERGKSENADEHSPRFQPQNSLNLTLPTELNAPPNGGEFGFEGSKKLPARKIPDAPVHSISDAMPWLRESLAGLKAGIQGRNNNTMTFTDDFQIDGDPRQNEAGGRSENTD